MNETSGSGRYAPARFVLAGLLLVTSAVAHGQARSPAPARAPAASTAAIAPDVTTILKMVWSLTAAVDHALQTGNFSVLRDLGAPSFQANNNPATLAGAFGALRAQRADLGAALVVTPNFDFTPTIVEGGLLRIRGNFPLRPNPIGFDLLYQNVSGQWRLFGLALAPLSPTAAPARR
jgi:hypothetical protein